MGIERGEQWGERGPRISDLPLASSDADAARLIAEHGDTTTCRLALAGGDLFRTLGGRAGRSPAGDTAQHLPLDAFDVRVDDHRRLAVAHVVVRHRLYRGRTVAVMNAAFVGRWNVAPRAHPGDGLAEIIDAQLGLSDRVKARRRLLSGDHLPHPDITARRAASFEADLERGSQVWIDGERLRSAHRIEVAVLADHWVGIV